MEQSCPLITAGLAPGRQHETHITDISRDEGAHWLCGRGRRVCPAANAHSPTGDHGPGWQGPVDIHRRQYRPQALTMFDGQGRHPDAPR